MPWLSLGGASWLRDRMIIFAGSKGISRVLATGGEPKLIVPAEEGQTFYGPRLLPDGDSLDVNKSYPCSAAVAASACRQSTAETPAAAARFFAFRSGPLPASRFGRR